MPMYSNDYSEDEAAGEKEEHVASSRERLLASLAQLPYSSLLLYSLMRHKNIQYQIKL